MRIGHGYDVHRLEEGRKLILGGVEIAYERGLAGHSDADVLIHAVIDALLGATGLGDIGTLFPDSEAQYKGISSLVLLEKVATIIRKNYTLSNIDCTIVAQNPKLSPYKEAMKNNLSNILDCDAVNIKAKTEEGLGFTGNGEGIAAHAVCLLEEKKSKSDINDRGEKFVWL